MVVKFPLLQVYKKKQIFRNPKGKRSEKVHISQHLD